MKSNKKVLSAALIATLCSTGISLPGYATNIENEGVIASEAQSNQGFEQENVNDVSESVIREENTEVENNTSVLAGLNTRGINPALPDNIVKSLLTDNFTVEDAKTLSTLRDAVLLEDSFNNVYSYTSQRFNTSTNYAVGTKINIYLVNTGSTNIRMYTTTQAGQTMESAIVRPGDHQLFTIDDNDIMYWGTEMEIGYQVLSYYIHADPATTGPISFTLRVKHYDVY